MFFGRAYFLPTVLLMLWGCVTIDTRDQLRRGMSKSELREITVLTTTIKDDPFVSPISEWTADQKIEILYAEGRKFFYVFTDVTRNTTGGRKGDGKLYSVHVNITAARRAVRELLSARRENAKPRKAQPKTETPVTRRRADHKVPSKKKKIRPLE